MITLQTGLPGAGKTLYMLNFIKALSEKENRPVYYSGIPDLNLPWIEFEPQEWFTLPPGSIVVIDECQRVFRPRQHGSNVPEFVAKLETHRHLGIDLFLITQHPMLVDANVRKLVGRHFHSVRAFGMNGARIHEWQQVKENCDKSRSDSVQHVFKYPKESFGWYKSAEVHTHKARIPMKVWMLAALLVLIPVLIWWVYMGLQNKMSGADSQPGQQTISAPGRDAFAAPGRSMSGRVMSQSEFMAGHNPRVPGLAYTAPVYDRVTEPTRAPYPAACAATADRCTCFSQQATKLDMPDDLCRSIVKDGFFMAWDEDKGRGDRPGRSSPVAPARERDRDEVQAGAGLGGFNTTRVASAEPVSTVKPPESQQTGAKGRATAP